MAERLKGVKSDVDNSRRNLQETTWKIEKCKEGKQKKKKRKRGGKTIKEVVGEGQEVILIITYYTTLILKACSLASEPFYLE